MLFHYKAISFNFQSIFSNFYNFLFSLSSFLSLNFSFLLFFADLFLIFFQRFFHTPSGLCFTFIILTMLRMRTVCLSPNRARKQKESVSAYASIASTLSLLFSSTALARYSLPLNGSNRLLWYIPKHTIYAGYLNNLISHCA